MDLVVQEVFMRSEDLADNPTKNRVRVYLEHCRLSASLVVQDLIVQNFIIALTLPLVSRSKR